jgi:hypothetical protein
MENVTNTYSTTTTNGIFVGGAVEVYEVYREVKSSISIDKYKFSMGTMRWSRGLHIKGLIKTRKNPSKAEKLYKNHFPMKRVEAWLVATGAFTPEQCKNIALLLREGRTY